MSTPLPKDVHVLAGVIFDASGRILLAQRPRGKDLAGYWEFPGGKLEPGETRFQALARELREELGISIGPARPLTRVRHAYPHKTVLLDFWIVRQFIGEVSGLDGQALKWCTADDLISVPLLPADRPMLRLLGLPERIISTSWPGFKIVALSHERLSCEINGIFCDDIKDALRAAASGADFLVMTRDHAQDQVAQLCQEIWAPVFVRGFDLDEAWHTGASGINLL